MNESERDAILAVIQLLESTKTAFKSKIVESARKKLIGIVERIEDMDARKEQIRVTPRISKKTGEFLEKFFITRNAGAEYVLESFKPLFFATLAEMRGMFSDSELKLILDVNNGHYITPQIAHSKGVILSVSDGIEYDNLNQKWCVDKAELLRKLNSITTFQAAVLEIWGNAFWHGEATLKTDEALRKHLEYLL